MSWPLVPLVELAASKPHAFVGGPFGSKLTASDYVTEGIPVIRGANLTGGRHLLEDNFVFVSEQKLRRDLSTNVAHRGDIVFTQRGTLGQVSIIPQSSLFSEYVISQSQMKLSVDSDKADSRFIYYWFSARETIEKLVNRNSSSGVPHINLTVLRKFDVPVPPLQEQSRIASILSAYDDLIENNRRRIALLEEAARQLYKEWFVRFRFPGHEHVKIIDGVPEGWKRLPLGKVATLNYGKALKAETRIPGDIPVYGSSGIVGRHNKALVPGPGIVLGRKGNVGSVRWSQSDFFPIDTVYFVGKEHASFHLYLTLQHMHFMSTDVAVPGLNRDFANSRMLIQPSTKVGGRFEDEMTPIFAQVQKLTDWLEKLARARDLLLPKLMSGAIAV